MDLRDLLTDLHFAGLHRLLLGLELLLAELHSLAPLGVVWLLGLHAEATYADAAKMLLGSLADQTEVPWPYDFSRKVVSTDSDVRDLQPQPSDDSAFQA